MDCLFCSIQEMSNPSNPEDEIIDESENFYAKAALGHFVFGYTLIISKDHFLSFAHVPERLFPELEAFGGMAPTNCTTFASTRSPYWNMVPSIVASEGAHASIMLTCT